MFLKTELIWHDIPARIIDMVFFVHTRQVIDWKVKEIRSLKVLSSEMYLAEIDRSSLKGEVRRFLEKSVRPYPVSDFLFFK